MDLYGIALVITRLYGVVTVAMALGWWITFGVAAAVPDHSISFLPRLHAYTTTLFTYCLVHTVASLALLIFSRPIARWISRS